MGDVRICSALVRLGGFDAPSARATQVATNAEHENALGHRVVSGRSKGRSGPVVQLHHTKHKLLGGSNSNEKYSQISINQPTIPYSRK